MRGIGADARATVVPGLPQAHEADVSLGFTIADPDGNLIYFNTMAGHDRNPESGA